MRRTAEDRGVQRAASDRNRRTPLRIVLEVVREPMLALLLGGGVVYLLLGDVTEALILLLLATLSVLITVVQETRTERVLRRCAIFPARVRWSFAMASASGIAGRDVVRGDFVVLAEGDRAPSDAVLVQGHDLQTDESLLTGEASTPCVKSPARIALHPKRLGRVAMTFHSQAFRFVGRARNRRRRGNRDRSTQRNWKNRTDAERSGSRAAPTSGPDPPSRPLRRYRWQRGKCPGSGALWNLARWMAGCAASQVSRSGCRCCPRSSQLYSRCSWRWARGESLCVRAC